MKVATALTLALAAAASFAQPRNAPLSSATPVYPGFGATAFSSPAYPVAQDAIQGSWAMTPDPVGTRYALTSVTVTNTLNVVQTVFFQVRPGNFGNTCGNSVPSTFDLAIGPVVVVPAAGTVHLQFPQPFITNAISSGPAVCLTAAATEPGATWSVVGYKLLP